MRPDLWSAAIGQAPFVDMLNTMSDATHPLVPLTRPVWGDPLSDAAAYDCIASYSPYENVRTQPHPAILATTAIADDDRVRQLAAVLPSFVGFNGLTDGWAELRSGLKSAIGLGAEGLPDDEWRMLQRLSRDAKEALSSR